MITFFTIWFSLRMLGTMIGSFTDMLKFDERKTDDAAESDDAKDRGAAFGFFSGVIVAAVVSLLVYAYFWRILPKAWGE